MNANELADEVVSINDAIESEYNRFKELDQAATMLRQQQADLEHMWMANTVLQVEVEALKAKTLTDEEIEDLADKYLSVNYKYGEDIYVLGEVEFARAILRKSQET